MAMTVADLGSPSRSDISLKKAETIVNIVFDSMKNAMIKGERIEIRGLVLWIIIIRILASLFRKDHHGRLLEKFCLHLGYMSE